MKFDDVLGAGSGVKAVDVLSYDDDTTTFFLQPRLTLSNCQVSLRGHRHHHHHCHHHHHHYHHHHMYIRSYLKANKEAKIKRQGQLNMHI